MKEIATALLKVMQDIKHLQKDTSVGSKYKGMSDEKVTFNVRQALIKHELVFVQQGMSEEVDIQWETNQYGGLLPHTVCRVKGQYLFIHAPSGESLQVESIGHGIDKGDKAAGKAMTYAKKNALLNSLLISTGLDADDVHSDDLPVRQEPTPSNAGTDKWKDVLTLLTRGTDKQKETLAKMLSSSQCNDIIGDATGDWENGGVDVIKAVSLFLKLTVGQPLNRYALAVAMSFCKDDSIVTASIKSLNEGKKSGKDALVYFINLKD